MGHLGRALELYGWYVVSVLAAGVLLFLGTWLAWSLRDWWKKR